MATWDPWRRWGFYVCLVIAPVFAIWMLIEGVYLLAAFFVVILPYPWLMSRVWNKRNPESLTDQDST